MTRRLLILAALALIPLAAQPSGASFTAVSTNAASTFTTAADFNTVAVTLADPGTPLRGTVHLSATASSDRGVSWVRFEHAPASGSSWTTICTDHAAPYECDWATAPDGLRDVRAVAHDAAGYERAHVRTSRVDNTAPALTFAPPAGLNATANLSLTAKETNGSGLAPNGVVLEVRAAGTTPWTPICTRSAETSSCPWDTSGLPEGDYQLRLGATDVAGNRAETTVTRRVDRSLPAAQLTSAPTGSVRATVSMTVDASDLGGSGIQRVVFEARQAGTATWYEACTVTTAPYTCAGDTRALVIPGLGTVSVPDGSYELRGVAYDAAGNKKETPLVTFQLDNTAPRATDIQGLNGGVADVLDAGDQLTLTFSEPVLPATIESGWDGTAPLAVTVRVADGGALDTLTVRNAGDTAQLALATSIALDRDVTTGGATFAGTLSRSGAVHTLTLGALGSGSVNPPAPAAGTLRWTPAAAVTDAAGNPAQTTTATETGAGDADL